MKILHVLHTSLPYIAGYCVRSDQIMRNTARLGAECVALTSAQHPNTTAEMEVLEDVRHYRTQKTGVPRTPVLRERALMRLLEERLETVLKAERPDVIHAHSPVLVGNPALRSARKARIPLVYEVRDLWENALVDRGRFGASSFLYQGARTFETRLLNRADHVVTISEQLKAEIRSRQRHPNVSVVGNGVDLVDLTEDLVGAAPAQLPFDNDWPTLGYIGTFQPYEGLRTLIDAYVRLRRQGRQLNLAIVGGGGEEGELRKYAEQIDVAPAVFMPGKVAKTAVPSFYKAIDYFAYPRIDSPTTRLTTPLKPLEAMVARKVVCVSDLPAMRELVSDRSTGRVFTAGDSGSLATVLTDLLDDADTTGALTKSAFNWVATRRDWRELAKNYLPIYEQCLEKAA